MPVSATEKCTVTVRSRRSYNVDCSLIDPELVNVMALFRRLSSTYPSQKGSPTTCSGNTLVAVMM